MCPHSGHSVYQSRRIRSKLLDRKGEINYLEEENVKDEILTFGANALLLKVIKVGTLFADVLVHLSSLALVVAGALGPGCRVKVLIAGAAAVVIDFTCHQSRRKAN